MFDYAMAWAQTVRSQRYIAREAELLLKLKSPPIRVQTANLQHLFQVGKNPRMRRAFFDADYVTSDGWPLVRFARRHGRPEAERVTGKSLCAKMASGDFVMPYVLLGTTPETCAAFANRAASHGSPRLACRHGDASTWSVDELAEELDPLGPCLILIALGAPKGEILAQALRVRLCKGSLIGVGGAVEMAVGHAPSAPRFVERANLEWLYRLSSQPRRLGRRYLIECPRVVVSLVRHGLVHGTDP